MHEIRLYLAEISGSYAQFPAFSPGTNFLSGREVWGGVLSSYLFSKISRTILCRKHSLAVGKRKQCFADSAKTSG